MIVELLKDRYSERNFDNKEVEKEIVDYIIEAGRLSASGNEQPWKFGIINDRLMIDEISKIAYNQSWIKSSPLLVVLCIKKIKDEDGCRDIQKSRLPKFKELIEKMDKEIYTYLNMEEHQTKIPGTQMVLAGLEKGVYSTWISYFNIEKLAEYLKLPEDIIPSELIAFGYPKVKRNGKEKKKVEDIVFYNSYIID